MHLKVALSITLIVIRILLLKLGPFKTFILQPLWTVNFIDPSRLQDEGFERIRFFTLLKRKIRVYLSHERENNCHF